MSLATNAIVYNESPNNDLSGDGSRGKVIKYITENNHFSVQIGATDNWMAPESVYLVLRAWIRPPDSNEREVTCNRIRRVSDEFRRHISAKRYKILGDTIFDTFYILDFKYGEFKNSSNPRMNIHIEFSLNQKDLRNLKPLTHHKNYKSGKTVENECRKLVDYIVRQNFFEGDDKFIINCKRQKCVL